MTGPTPDATAPLSFQQAESLRNMRSHPDCIHRYDMVCLFRLDGPVDRSALAAATHDLADRHAVLRTTISSDGVTDLQRVHPEPLVPLRTRDWSGHTEDTLVSTLLDERHGTADVLAGKPLFRPALHQLDGELLLSFTVHHLVYDGWSVPVLWRDLSAAYRARTEGRTADLPELPLSYSDFARTQREAWPQIERDTLDFWSRTLHDAPRSVKWPAPTEPPALSSPKEIAQIPFGLGTEVSDAVRRAARSARVSPFVVLLCATAVGIARVTGQYDLVFATDTANREDRDKRDAVGFYVNSKPARIQVVPGRPFADLVRTVWESWLAAEAHRDAYSDLILQSFGSPPTIKVNMFNFSYGGYETPLFPGVKVHVLPVRPQGFDWRDFSLFWGGEDKEYGGTVLYRPAHVGRPAAERVLAHLRELLAAPGAIV
ncbi:condensation domain-containing protein [Streptomyces sp. NPDC048338]|uniref:condensation domain-containing protein n=1 Tax=Streptomyces sp. NPDC048338 TaxID=3365536 RepID=UPI00371B1310